MGPKSNINKVKEGTLQISSGRVFEVQCGWHGGKCVGLFGGKKINKVLMLRFLMEQRGCQAT